MFELAVCRRLSHHTGCVVTCLSKCMYNYVCVANIVILRLSQGLPLDVLSGGAHLTSELMCACMRVQQIM